jgi:DNA-binding transcriptional ArsR family regulator
VPADNQLDLLFGALANRSRRELVLRLRRGPLVTPQIGKHFEITKQALSRHISVLRDAGLVTAKTRGRVQELSLNATQLDRITRWVHELQRGWAASLERLDEVLHEPRH